MQKTRFLQFLWFLAFKGPRDPLKGTRGPLEGPRGPFKGPRGHFKGPRAPALSCTSVEQAGYLKAVAIYSYI